MSTPKPVALADAEEIARAQRYVLDRIDRDENGCWVWRGNKLHGGHGQGKWRRYPIKAHRLAYAAFVGEPGELSVLHRCDNPPCCNPQHHFLGTKADNNRDAFVKGRYKLRSNAVGVRLYAGDVRACRKVSEDVYHAIIDMRLDGASKQAIGYALDLSPTTVTRVLAGDHSACVLYGPRWQEAV